MATFPREVRTARLRLRPLDDGDVDALAEIYADPGYLAHMPAVDLPATAAQVARFTARWEADGFGLWAAEDPVTGILLGRIGVIRHVDWPLEEGPVEVGWVLTAEARGRGLATEGGAAALDAAFAALDVDRVLSITTPANLPSQAVMRRLGLTYRGATRWRDVDVVWWALDREAWAARSA